tara:strand:- start:1726 stop:2544 length:819 start_codon:yes stop_codon:yes gene_type:complete
MTKRTLWDDKNIKMRIVDKYYTVIEELLCQLEKVLNNITDININACMYIAVNSIHRVFEYVLIKTKNIEKAYYYAQKTYFYYIEYMEQIYKTNLQNNLNQTDAVLFIYKKTIFEIQNGNESKTFDTITNIMTFEDEITDINYKEYKEWLQKLCKVVNTFFNWENTRITFDERIKLSNSLLQKFLLQIDTINDIFYLELLQEKLEMNYSTYYDLLNEYLEYQKKNTYQYDDYDIESKCFMLRFYTEKNTMYETYEKNDMKGLIKWMYDPFTIV